MKARADLAGCACSLSVALSRSITEIQVGCLVKFFCLVSGVLSWLTVFLKYPVMSFFIVVFFVRFKCQFIGN